MTTLALASFKHAPGVTTAAVALAAAHGSAAIVIEADPAGGDLAARTRLPFEPGMVTLAASGRHGAPLDLRRHSQPLPAGGSVVVAPTEPELAASAIAAVASRLVPAAGDEYAIVDCGRLFAGSPALPAAAGADLLLLVCEPTVAAVEHLRTRLASIQESRRDRPAILLVGDRPYGPDDVEHALACPVAGTIAIDPRGVAALHAGAGARRSMLVRSARTVLDAVHALATERAGAPV